MRMRWQGPPRATVARGLAVCASVAAVMHGRPGVAEADDGASRRVSVIAVATPTGRMERLLETIEELVSTLPVQLDIERTSSLDTAQIVAPPIAPEPALARFWIELDASRATIVLVDGPWERILFRHVPLPRGLDVVAREEVAMIVFAAIEATLGGARIEVTRSAAPRTMVRAIDLEEPQDDSDIAPPSRFLLLEVCEAVRLRAPDVITHEPAVRVGMAFGAPSTRLVVLISGGVRLPHTVTAGSLDLRMAGTHLRLMGGLELEVGDGAHVRILAGAGQEQQSVESRTVDGTVLPAEKASFSIPVVSAAMALTYAPLENLGIGAGIDLDLDLQDTHFVLGPDFQTVYRPNTVRPALWLGLLARL